MQLPAKKNASSELTGLCSAFSHPARVLQHLCGFSKPIRILQTGASFLKAVWDSAVWDSKPGWPFPTRPVLAG